MKNRPDWQAIADALNALTTKIKGRLFWPLWFVFYDYTAPPPNETNVGHPDALAGHRGDGGAGNSRDLTKLNLRG
jgi:hypothetical protein